MGQKWLHSFLCSSSSGLLSSARLHFQDRTDCLLEETTLYIASYTYNFGLFWVHFGVRHDRRGQWHDFTSAIQSFQHHLLTRGFTLHWIAMTSFLNSRDDRYSSLDSISVTCVSPDLSNMSWLLTLWQLTLVLKLGSLNMWNPRSLFFFNTVLMRSNLLLPCDLWYLSVCTEKPEAVPVGAGLNLLVILENVAFLCDFPLSCETWLLLTDLGFQLFQWCSKVFIM